MTHSFGENDRRSRLMRQAWGVLCTGIVLAWGMLGFVASAWAGYSNLRTGAKITASKTSVNDGEFVDVTVPIWNNGPDTTKTSVTGSNRSFYVAVYLSTNPGDLRGARMLRRVLVPSLSGGARTTTKISVQIPAGWAAGTNYFHAVVDERYNYVRNESDETDNYSYVYDHSMSIQVAHKRSNLRTYANLRLSKTTLLDTESFTIDVPVENNGNTQTLNSIGGSARSFYVQVYLSRYPGTIRGATSLTRLLVNSLAASGRFTARLNVKVPTNWAAGTSYVHAVVDGYSNYVRNESDETDNYSYTYGHSVAVTIGRLRSNLKTNGSLKPSKSKPAEGEVIQVVVPIENNGNAPTLRSPGSSAASHRLYFYLSTEPGSTTGWRYLTYVNVNSLAAGAKSSVTTSITIPAGTVPGKYYLHAYVDGANYIRNESDETDNYSFVYGHSVQIEITRRRSNVKTSGTISVSNASPLPGVRIQVTVPIENNGTDETRSSVSGRATGFYYAIYLSRYPNSITSASRLAYVSLSSSLKAGAKITQNYNVTIPSSWPRGRSYIHVLVDANSAVRNEHDEGDNYSYWYGHSRALDIGGENNPLNSFWADLRTGQALKLSKSKAFSGELVTITAKIRNDGSDETLNNITNGVPTNFSVRFYISRLANSLDGATTLGTVSVPSLAKGASTDAILTAKLPVSWVEGTSFIHVFVDSSNNVRNELNHADNYSYRQGHSGTIAITAPRSNLLVNGRLTACKSKVLLGDQLCVTVPVINKGNDETRTSASGTPSTHILYLYASQFPNSLQGAVRIASATLGNLPAGAAVSPTIFGRIPATWPTGKTYLHAVVDATNTVKNESNEGDNSSFLLGFSASVDVLAESSNLRSTSKMLTDKTAYDINQNVRATIQITNTGKAETLDAVTGKAVRFPVTFYITNAARGLQGARRVGTVYTDALAPGRSRGVSLTFKMPGNWPVGTTYIHAFIDSNDIIKNESSESDNYSYILSHSTTVSVSRRFSNLVNDAKITTSSTTPRQNDLISVQVRVRNDNTDPTLNAFGGAPTRSQVYLYVSQFPTSILGGTRIGSAELSVVQGSGKETVYFTVRIPSSYKVGRAYLHAQLDATDLVKNEFNEGDNLSGVTGHSIAIDVRAKGTPPATNGQSNLRVSAALGVSKSSVFPGQRLYVTVPVWNNGAYMTANRISGSATGFYVEVYISRTSTTHSGGTYLGRVFTDALPANGKRNVTFYVTIPTSWKSGTSYIHGLVDQYSARVRNESNENDNNSYHYKFSTAVSVRYNLSNLRTASPISVNRRTVADGEQIDVIVPVTNNGSDSTRSSTNGSLVSSYVYVYLSSQPGTTSSARNVGRALIPVLKAGDAADGKVTITVPANWPAGVAYVHAYVDGTSSVRNESDENDNYSYSYKHSTTITVTNKRSNLRTNAKMTVSQGVVSDGDYINVTVPVVNNGNDITRNSSRNPTTHYAYVYISQTAGSLVGARALTRGIMAALKPGEAAQVTIRIQIPVGWVPGTSYIHAVVDGYSNYVRNESNENDNASFTYGHSASIEVQRQRSNLKTNGSLVLSKTTAGDGEYVTVTVPVLNDGNAPTLSSVGGSARGFYVEVYLAPRPGDLTSASVLSRLYVQPLQSKQAVKVQLNVRIPVNTVPSRWFVHARLNFYSSRVGNESDLQDNYSYSYQHSSSLTVVQKRSNLKTNGLVTSSNNNPWGGDTITITAPIKNFGNVDTLNTVSGSPAKFYVAFYINRHPTSLTKQVYLGRQYLDSMSAGLSRNAVLKAKLPSWIDGGTVYLHACLDYTNSVRNESDETDNCSYATRHSAAITLKGRPTTPPKWSNLTSASAVQSNKQLLAEGATFTVSLPVKNIGQAETKNSSDKSTNFQVRFYIARNPSDLRGARSLGDVSVHSLKPGAQHNVFLQAQLPTGWPAGLSYIHAQIDRTNIVANEIDRQDNLSYQNKHSAQLFVGQSASNLRTQKALTSGSKTASRGQRVEVVVSVLNNGNDETFDTYGGRARTFEIYLYLSQDPKSLAQSVRVATYTMASLAAGAARSATIAFVVPANWPTQTAYVHAVVDATNTIKNESNEGDNDSFRYNHSLKLPIQSENSDLVTSTKVALSTTSTTPDGFVTATIAIRNAGNAETLNTVGGSPTRHQVYLYISQFPTGLLAATRVATRYVDSMKGGASTTVRLDFRVPTTWPIGRSYIHVLLDGGKQIGNEISTGNNTSFSVSHSATLTVARSLSNLRANGVITASNKKPNAGSPLFVTVPVYNEGPAATRNSPTGTVVGSTAELWISQWPNSLLGGSRLGTYSVAKLNAKETDTARFWATVPKTWVPGRAYLHLRVDSSNAVRNESNEGDNWSYFTKHSLAIDVLAPGNPPNNSGPSNLTHRSKLVASNTSPSDGERITVTTEIANTGGAVTARALGSTETGFAVYLYISKATGTLSGATRVGSFSLPPLPGGAKAKVPVQITIPSGWKGNAYLHSHVDVGNSVRNESDENDNFSFRSGHSLVLNIQQARSNLVFSKKLSLSKGSMLSGQYMDVTATVKNVGNAETLSGVGGSSASPRIYFYISKNSTTTSGATYLGAVTLRPMKAGQEITTTYTLLVPVSWTSGTSYVHGFVDANNTVRNESNEGDNYSYTTGHSTSVAINSRQSNLKTAGMVAADSSTVPDNTYINVSVPVINDGAIETRNSSNRPSTHYVYFYLSRATGTLTGARYISRVSMASLKSKEVKTARLRILIPKSWPVGTSYIHTFVDGLNYIRNESSETDNYSYSNAHSLKINVVHRRSNLRPHAKISVSNSAPGAGAYVMVYVPVENNGLRETLSDVEGTPRTHYVYLYLGPQPNSLSGATRIGSLLLKSMLSKERTVAQVLVRLSTSQRAGKYYIHAHVDAANYVRNESDKKDNYSYNTGHSAVLYVGTPRSNLRTQGPLQLSRSQVKDGETLIVSVPAVNAGSDDTRGTVSGTKLGYKVNVYLSTKPNSVSGASLVGTLTYNASLAAGGAVYHRVQVSVPKGLKGTYWVHSWLDTESKVGNETDKADNYSYITGHSVKLGINELRSNLRTYAKLVPATSTVGIGAQVRVNVPVENADNDITRATVGGSSSGFEVWLYVSPFSTSLTGAVLLGKSTLSAALAAGGKRNVTVSGTLPSGWTGIRYLHAVLNPVDGSKRRVGNERDFTDNFSGTRSHSVSITITTDKAADVATVAPVQLSSSTGPVGTKLQATVQIQNVGNAPTQDAKGNAKPVSVRLYFGKSATDWRSATLVGATTTSTGLSVGQAVTLNVSFNVPSVSLGTYFVHAYVLPVDNETNKVNNESNQNGHSASFRVASSSKSDLLHRATLSSSVAVPYAGQSITVTVPFRNAGTAPTRNSSSGQPSGFDVAVYLAPNASDLKSAVLLGRRTLASALAAGTDASLSITGQIPTTWAAGTAYLHAVLDPGSLVGNESDRSNNNSYQTKHSLTLTITRANQTQRSNLRFNQALWSGTSQPYPGQSLTVGYTLLNNGNDQTRSNVGGNTTGFKVGFFLSQSSNSLAKAVRVGTGTVGSAIASNGQITEYAQITIPTGTAAGRWFLHAVADVDTQVGNESVRSDNQSWTTNHSKSLTIASKQQHADLFIKGTIKVSATAPSPGQSIQVQFTVGNQGNTATQTALGGSNTGFSVAVYLGPNAGDLKKAVRLNAQSSSALSATSDRLLSVQGAIPANFALGTAYIHVAVDSLTQVGNESDRWNNESFKTKQSVAIQIQKASEPKPEQPTEKGGERPADSGAEKPGDVLADAGSPDASGPEQGEVTPEQPSTCYTKGCPSGQICRNSACVDNPCAKVNCKSGEFCRDGTCYTSCANVRCASNERCQDGKCQPNPCAGVSCNAGEVCDAKSGQCISDPCASVSCQAGRVCVDGKCEDDPCSYTTCPSGTACRAGQCLRLCSKEAICESVPEPTGEVGENVGDAGAGDGGSIEGNADDGGSIEGNAGESNTEGNAGEANTGDGLSDGDNQLDRADIDGRGEQNPESVVKESGSGSGSGGKKDGGTTDTTGGTGEGCCQVSKTPPVFPLFLTILFLLLPLIRRRRQ